LGSLAQKSFLVREVVATSRDLSAIGGAGLAAIDAITSGNALSADQQAQFNAVLGEAGKAKTQLLLIPVPGVQKLVKAASQAPLCR
ncbi:MAG TPA: hypothetical protein VMT51_11720, partial [Dongiaceae bacterium]|nr:hypothetical protein [Dongiaceae bacterium]